MNMYHCTCARRVDGAYVCANTAEEVEIIAKLGLGLKGKVLVSKPIPYLWDLRGDTYGIDEFIGGLSTGYFDSDSTEEVMYGSMQAVWFPFIEFNIRKHYVDLVLKELE